MTWWRTDRDDHVPARAVAIVPYPERVGRAIDRHANRVLVGCRDRVGPIVVQWGMVMALLGAGWENAAAALCWVTVIACYWRGARIGR